MSKPTPPKSGLSTQWVRGVVCVGLCVCVLALALGGNPLVWSDTSEVGGGSEWSLPGLMAAVVESDVGNKEDIAGGPQFYPPKLWGLDYHFSVFNKMYVADIVAMPEYPLFSGAFCYNNHPVYKVDVLGTIVKKSENSKCFVYAVDDGTGVILCCCWKENFYKPSVGSDCLGHLPACLQEKARELRADGEDAVQGYSLGELVHMRGKVKLFRGQKEVMASYHKRVDDPMYQVFRLLELPRLYRLSLDIPFTLPSKVQYALQEQSGASGTGRSEARLASDLKSVIFNYISGSDHIIDLDPHDLLKYAKVKDMLTEEGQTEPDTQTSMPVILQALASMEDEGYVTRRTDRRILYEVLLHRSKLERKIQMILNEETTKLKYASTGCHYLHIVDELHKTYQYARMKKEAVMYCLQKLEAQSDVIRATHAHYLPCTF